MRENTHYYRDAKLGNVIICLLSLSIRPLHSRLRACRAGWEITALCLVSSRWHSCATLVAQAMYQRLFRQGLDHFLVRLPYLRLVDLDHFPVVRHQAVHLAFHVRCLGIDRGGEAFRNKRL